MRNSFFLLCVVLLVEGVPGDDDDVEVSVLKGDSVTLKPVDVEVKKDDLILWKFKGDLISTMKKAEDSFIITNNDADKKFSGRLEPNKTTGSLKITNITDEHAGDYQVEMKIKKKISKSYNVIVNGGERTMIVTEGKPITLDTGLLIIKEYNQILWKYEDQIIAEIDQVKNLFLHHDDRVERLKGRLQLNDSSGFLTINFFSRRDSGVYHLQMNSRSHTLQRNISVSVNDSDSSGAVSGIYSASFGLVIWAVTASLLQV